MSSRVSLYRDQQGVGLLFALFGAAIIAIVAWSMITTGLLDLAISDNFRSHKAAFYAADAGVEQTLIDFKVDLEWVTQLIDLDSAQITGPGSATITINGIAVELELDEDGLVVPKYYPMGGQTTIGDAIYQREVWLPPTVAVGDCEIVDDDADEDEEPADGSGTSKSGKSGSGKSKSGKSKSGKSTSGGSGGSFAAFVPASAPTLGLAPLALTALGAKTDVCHVPPGNPDEAHTISVSTAAVPAHMAHGDSLGACAGEEEEVEEGAEDSVDVDLDDPCELLQSLLDGSGSSSGGDEGSGGSGSGKSKSGKSKSGKSDSGKSDSGKSKSGKSGSSDDFAGLAQPVALSRLALAPLSLTALTGPKVTICHVPPGNPGNAQTISISAAALSAHLANHGDTVGACAGDDGDDSDPDLDLDDLDDLLEDDSIGAGLPVYALLKVRSTGTASNGAQTRILAELLFTLSVDSDVLDIQVQNWREDR